MSPFTYLIGWPDQDRWYYGVRYSRRCHPNDLWTKYFTSSKHVAKFRQVHGEPSVIQVRKVFSDAASARRFEEGVLHKLNVMANERWLNRTESPGFPSLLGKKQTPGWAEVSRKNAIKNARNNIGRKRPEHSLFMKEFHKTHRHQMPSRKGSRHTEETKAIMSERASCRQKVCCISCHREKPEGISTPHYFNHHRNCNPWL